MMFVQEARASLLPTTSVHSVTAVSDVQSPTAVTPNKVLSLIIN